MLDEKIYFVLSCMLEFSDSVSLSLSLSLFWKDRAIPNDLSNLYVDLR